jgi:hypothetical protein
MLTARRLHEQREREAAGMPEPPPRAPDFIPFGEHEAALRELRKAHAAELAAVQVAAAGGPVQEGLVDASALEEVSGELEATAGELGAALEALAGEVGMAEIRNVRRFYLHKRLTGNEETRPVWQAKQEEQPGTALAEDFPCRAELAELGYTTAEDLDGADQDELVRAGLKTNQAKKVIAAL